MVKQLYEFHHGIGHKKQLLVFNLVVGKEIGTKCFFIIFLVFLFLLMGQFCSEFVIPFQKSDVLYFTYMFQRYFRGKVIVRQSTITSY